MDCSKINVQIKKRNKSETKKLRNKSVKYDYDIVFENRSTYQNYNFD